MSKNIINSHFNFYIKENNKDVLQSLHDKVSKVSPGQLDVLSCLRKKISEGLCITQTKNMNQREKHFLNQLLKYEGVVINCYFNSNIFAVAKIDDLNKFDHNPSGFSDMNNMREEVCVDVDSERLCLINLDSLVELNFVEIHSIKSIIEYIYPTNTSKRSKKLVNLLAHFDFLTKEKKNNRFLQDNFEKLFHFKTKQKLGYTSIEPLTEKRFSDIFHIHDENEIFNFKDYLPIFDEDKSFESVLKDRNSSRNSRGLSIKDHRWKNLLFSFLPSIKNKRLYPLAGAIDELEIFYLVNNCENLKKGLYYLSKEKKALYKTCNIEQKIDSTLLDAQNSLGNKSSSPDAMLIFVSNRMGLKKKYGSLAYRLNLLNSGVMIEHVYLMCSLLDIGVCAIGSQSSKHFSKMTGVSDLHHPSLAEIALFS